MLLVLACINLLYLATFSICWCFYDKLSLSVFYTHFALYHTMNDASSSPHVGTVCRRCPLPSTPSSIATVLTSSLHPFYTEHLIALSIKPWCCPRRVHSVASSCYCHLDRTYRSTAYDIRAFNARQNRAFGHYACTFTSYLFVYLSEILDTEWKKKN